MSILSRNQVIDAVKQGKIQFDPSLDKFQLSPIAVDLRVGSNFFIPRLSVIGSEGRTQLDIDHLDNKMKNEVLDQIHITPGQVFELLPGEFILISSLEKIFINSGELMALLFPRSSTSRRGLFIESGVVDPYYEGYLTIPVLNQTKTQIIKIYPGERIAQLVFQNIGETITSKDAQAHGTSKPKYQGSKAYMLDFKFDPHDEINLIREGKISQIKKEYKIDIKKIKTKSDEKNEHFEI